VINSIFNLGFLFVYGFALHDWLAQIVFPKLDMAVSEAILINYLRLFSNQSINGMA